MTTRERLVELERFARDAFIPILKPDSWEIFRKELLCRNPEKILEIGTAIGYSAIKILDTLPKTELVTLEIRKCRAAQAARNLKESGFAERTSILTIDAGEFLESTEETFDCIFLDGPKGQYRRYLMQFPHALRAGGWIFADNLDYDGRVDAVKKQGLFAIPRKHRAAVKSLIEYRKRICEAPYSTEFYKVGDGIAVTTIR